jgi:hypothetical protein
MTTTATTGNITEYLKIEGFRDATSDTPWFRKGRIAVAIDGGHVSIYVFDRPQDAVKLRWAAWDVKLAGAPDEMVIRTIELARQMVATSMLPAD